MTSRVIVRSATYEPEVLRPLVFEMMEAMGGSEIRRGARILVKPNLLCPAEPHQAILTHPVIVRAAVEYILEKGAKPLIADSPAIGSFEKILRMSGIRDALKGLDVECRPFEKSVRVEIGEPFGAIDIAEDAVRSDAIVNLAKLKTHSQMLITLTVKNLFGCIIGYRKPEWHMRAGVEQQVFAKLLVRICETLHPTFNILDGILALEGAGPGRGGSPKELGVMLGGSDPFAVDLAVCRMIGLNPALSPVLKASTEMGRSAMTAEIDGSLPVIQGFRLPQLTHLVYGPRCLQGFIRRQLLQRPVCSAAKCRMCGECWKLCPANAIRPEGQLRGFDYDRCIRCYCCIEVCPSGALRPVETIAGRIARRVAAALLPSGRAG